MRDRSASRGVTVAFYRQIECADAKASRLRFVTSVRSRMSALIAKYYNIDVADVDVRFRGDVLLRRIRKSCRPPHRAWFCVIRRRMAGSWTVRTCKSRRILVGT